MAEMTMKDVRELGERIRQESLRQMALNPGKWELAEDEESYCLACENARTILVCPCRHSLGCDCAEVEVPCHACR